MLDKTNFAKQMRKLAVKFSYKNDMNDPDVLSIWYEDLGNFTEQEFELAINKISENEKFFPTVAHFVEYAGKKEPTIEERAVQISERIWRATGFGNNGYERAKEWLGKDFDYIYSALFTNWHDVTECTDFTRENDTKKRWAKAISLKLKSEVNENILKLNQSEQRTISQ
jgi:hypothetical protein